MSHPPDTEKITHALLRTAVERPKRVVRPWSDRDRAFLVKHYRKRGAAWCAQKLRRTVVAVRIHAPRCGATRPNWSKAEVKILRREWGEVSERRLRALLPGRSWAGIAAKATKLGLAHPSQGRVAIKAAAVRAGVTERTLLRILAIEGVAVRRWVRSGVARRSAKGRYTWRTVDLDRALAAVRAYDKRCAATLTGVEAAEKYGVSDHTLREALALLAATRPVEGLSPRPGCAARLWPADVEEALQLHARSREAAQGNDP